MEGTVMNRSDTIIFIRSLLVAHKEMYMLSEFLNDFEEEAGYGLPTFGYGTALEFLKSIPDTVQVISTSKNTFLKLVESQKSAHVRSAVVRSSAGGGTRREFSRAQDSSSMSRNQKEHEPVAEAKSLDDKSHKGKLKKKTTPEAKMSEGTSKDAKLKYPTWYNEEREDEKLENQNFTYQEILCYRCLEIEADLENLACIDECISSVILDDSEIPFINLTDHVKAGDYVEVCVQEVCNPHKFIFHLRKFKLELTKLMGRMLKFYGYYSNNYAVKNYKFKKNQICAALYRTQPNFREWYRAKMINYGLERSRVLLIDFGVTVDVRSNNLKYLDRDFGYLPVQAINGHLANIRPSGGSFWSEGCNKRFFELVFEKDLVAGVVDVDNEKQWLSVALSHTDGEDIHISDLLVEEGFAVFDFDSKEESAAPVICESFNQRGLLHPEKMGRIRRQRSYPGYCGEVKSKKDIPNRRRNNKLKKMFGMEVSDDESSSD